MVAGRRHAGNIPNRVRRVKLQAPNCFCNSTKFFLHFFAPPPNAIVDQAVPTSTNTWMAPDPVDTSRADLSRETSEFFDQRFGQAPSCVATAPGRVNLIGEHTDYNDGFVFPAAINRITAVAASPRADRNLLIHAQNLNATMMVSLEDLTPRSNGAWSNYIAGVAHFLRQRGEAIAGANILVNSTVPRGSGLSSSAALEVASAHIFMTLNAVRIPELEVVLLCQKAENDFVGVKCGIMDQFISALGRKGHAMRIDCRSLEFEHVPFPAGVQLIVCDTRVRRALASSEYNRRREECTAGAQALSRYLPALRNLRDVGPEQLETFEQHLEPTIRRRCRHVVRENARVLESVRALNNNDLSRFGALMYESHASLRDDYEVSCRELDAVVEICASSKGVFGARMTGGGFGGSAICLVRDDCVGDVTDRLSTLYLEKTGRKAGILVCTMEDGVTVGS
jgi:galactokinase